MRILRLDLDSGEELDLHPYVTVLGGLDPGLRRRVIDQVARLSRGDAEGIAGLVEAHGMLIEITPQRVTSLGLPEHADVIVEADQLPGARVVASDTAEHAEQRSLRDKVAAVEAELSRLTSEISRVAAEMERRTVELDDARRSVDEFAVTAHEAAVRAVAEAEALVRRRLDAGASGAGVADLPRQSAEEAERERVAEGLAEQRRRHSDLEAVLDEERLGLLQLLEQLEAEQQRLDALRAEQADDAQPALPEPLPAPVPAPAGPDPAVVAQVGALISEVVAGPPDVPMVPSLPAAALADQVAAHHQRQAEFDRELIERGLDPQALRERLAYARRSETDAAEAARPRTVSPEDDAAIERLHDIVVENADKRESRRHGKEATRLYEEASAQLNEVLERYGFPTYASFIMGRTAPAVDVEARRRHDEAKAMVAALERELAEMETALAEDPHGRMLRAEHDQLWAAARDLLGHLPHDVESALRNHLVPGDAHFDAPDRLRDVLRRLGVDTAHAATTGALLDIADAWHREATATTDPSPIAVDTASDAIPAEPTIDDAVAAQEALIADLLERSRRLDAELASREAASDELAAQIAAIEAHLMGLDQARGDAQASADSTGAGGPDPAALVEAQLADDPTVRAAREQQALVAARLERHHHAVELVDRLHAAIGEQRQTERSLAAQRDALHAELDHLRREATRVLDGGSPLPPVEWHLTDEGVGPIEWYLLGRVASLRSVSSAGSVPLIINDAFRGLSSSDVSTLCAALARIGETVQVIYLGDELAMVEWAEGQGLDRAAVVRPGQPAI
jgi:hypothetical protein